jgi:hypothetical protein
VRNKDYLLDPDIADIEAKLTESLGTRVKIEKKDKGGKVVIDFFTTDDLHSLFEHLKTNEVKPADHLLDKFAQHNDPIPPSPDPQALNKALKNLSLGEVQSEEVITEPQGISEIISAPPVDDRSKEEKIQQEEDLYSVKNFSV